MSRDPIESVRAQLAADRALRVVVTAILDRCDRRGQLPKRMALRFRTSEEHEAAERLLSTAAVRPLHNGRAVRLDLARADAALRAEGWPGLSAVLYAAADRQPRNLYAEAAALGARAAQRALSLAVQHRGAAAAFLRVQAERLATGCGELFELARAKGLTRVEAELSVVARCLELAEHNDQPIRLANFARRAIGTTKGLRSGDRRYARVTDALLQHLPGLAERVAAEGPRELADRRRLALECLNIFRNETPIDVLCYGHVVLEKQAHRFDAAALHHALGEPCRMLLLHLRGARVADMRAERIVSIENETTFNDYVEWLRARGRDEIVLLSEGQANWAVVRLVCLLAAAAPDVPIVHWGDLDRFGVLILRSLRQRTGLAVQPWLMDVSTFERFASVGLPLADGEVDEIDSLLARSSADVGGELLRAMRDAKRWVEQEAVAEEVLRNCETVK